MTLPETNMPPRRLPELLDGLAAAPVPDIEITGVTADSRRVRSGSLFLARPGAARHGLDFAAEAVARGAAAVAWDGGGSVAGALGAPAVRVTDLLHRSGEIASRYYGHPSRELFMAGITGTDGKTSCAHILAQALEFAGRHCGYLGTLGYGALADLAPAARTTPEAVDLQDWLARLVAAGMDTAAVEVSSHALDQGRVDGTAFDVAVLTHIGRDHLDYHGNVAAYAAAKRRLFEMPGLRAAVLNADDAHGRAWLETLPERVEPVAYGLDPDAAPAGCRRLVAREVLAQPHGLTLDVTGDWGGLRVHSRLIGQFNSYNLLAALAVLLLRDMEPSEAVAALDRVVTVPGRMELVDGGPGRPLVVVDYAHTAGSLDQALHAVAAHCRGRLICVFGCGGERDRGKRPLMATAAARHADAIWVTDDNPRGENPKAIVADILAGFPAASPVIVEHDRARAIAAAIAAAGPGDAVLIAGKGHESYQLVAGQRRPFDDRAAARRALEAA
jgi:UDP-N-acetylmuramoyl-L-alanyl-D-glutamate--2,6-diaminopimelate ligase